ncbi:PP2C family protein-serine/threonine phosphatase [Algivirga pacifica]|uniref:PPM-type phosphatase domain-containing protein n=1 Tax=Algivirga pacifica TaxID=1162670 RepID=A0ABP9DBE3_9BACT
MKNEQYQSVKQKADKALKGLLLGSFVFGLFIANFYDTWMIAAGVGALNLSAFFLTHLLLPKSTLYQYVASVILAIFVAQYIYQMHGLFEMHFFAFIYSAFLISFQNWKLQVPFIITIALHHGLFAYAQFSGKPDIYFTQLDYMDLQTFTFHILLAATSVFVSGYWAYSFSKRTEIDEAQKEQIRSLYDKAKKNKMKLDESINYAKRIQQLMLPELNKIREILPSTMIFYKPKDVVSGDTYWHTYQDNKYFLAAIDCTGHGVPGAFMSILATEKLHEIVSVRKIMEPAKILTALDHSIQKVLKQRESGNMDGMTISLCVVDAALKKLHFAGAKSPLVIANKEQVLEVKGDKKPIGYWRYDSSYQFEEQEISLKEDDTYYMFSDGYQDQFGGPDNKKFGKKRLKSLIQELSENMHTPKEKLQRFEQAFFDWKGSKPQIDDILVMGFSANDILSKYAMEEMMEEDRMYN